MAIILIKISIFRNYAYLFLLVHRKRNDFTSLFNVLAFEFDKNARIEFYMAKYREQSDRLLVKTKSIFSFTETEIDSERAVNFFPTIGRARIIRCASFFFFFVLLSVFFPRFFFVPVHLVVAAKVIDRSIDRFHDLVLKRSLF